MKKYPPEFKKYIKALAQYIRTETYHGEYEMKICWHEEDDIDHDTAQNHGRGKAAAGITVDHVYLNYQLHISAQVFEFYKAKDWWQLGVIMTHEFCHLLTEPLYHFAIDACTNYSKPLLEDIRERQTQRIANIMMSLLPAEFSNPKKLKTLK